MLLAAEFNPGPFIAGSSPSQILRNKRPRSADTNRVVEAIRCHKGAHFAALDPHRAKCQTAECESKRWLIRIDRKLLIEYFYERGNDGEANRFSFLCGNHTCLAELFRFGSVNKIECGL